MTDHIRVSTTGVAEIAAHVIVARERLDAAVECLERATGISFAEIGEKLSKQSTRDGSAAQKAAPEQSE